jgi:hypothetical protein
MKATLIGSGIMTGAAAERQAGKMAGRTIQAINAPEQIIKKLGNSKYGKVLQDALSKGNKSFATTHYLLLQQDPEYRKQIEETE